MYEKLTNTAKDDISTPFDLHNAAAFAQASWSEDEAGCQSGGLLLVNNPMLSGAAHIRLIPLRLQNCAYDTSRRFVNCASGSGGGVKHLSSNRLIS